MANLFWVGGTASWTSINVLSWATSSGGTGGLGVALPPGVGDTATFDGSSGGGTVTVNTTVNCISITMGAFTGTLDFSANNNNVTLSTFSGTGTGTRTLNMGSGTWTITGNNTTIWTIATSTNLTFSGASSTLNFSYSGGTGTRIMTFNSALSYGVVNVTAGSDIVQLGAFTCTDNSFAGFTGTLNATTGAQTLTGNLVLGTGMTITTSANTITFTPTSGTKTITSNNVLLNRPVTINATAGVTVQLIDNLVLDHTLGLSQGIFDANNKAVTTTTFSSNNSGVRTIIQGTGQWTITGSAATIWNVGTATNLTFTKGTLPIICNYSGATGTRTIAQGSLAAAGGLSAHPDFNITLGTDTVTFSNTRVGNVNFTGFTGTLGNGVLIVYGLLNLTGITALTSGTNAISFFGTSGTQIFTTGGITIDRPVTINCPSAITQIADSLVMGTTSTSILTLTAGTFDVNNKAPTIYGFATAGSTTRVLLMGTNTWTIIGTGTVWNVSSITALTITSNSSTIKITDSTNGAITFGGGGMTYNNIWFARGASTATNTISGSNTFNDFKDTGTEAHQITFTTATTTTVVTFTVSGTSGKNITLRSSTTTNAILAKSTSGEIQCAFMDVDYITGNPDDTWYMGSSSVDGGHNVRIYFVVLSTLGRIHKNFNLFPFRYVDRKLNSFPEDEAILNDLSLTETRS